MTVDPAQCGVGPSEFNNDKTYERNVQHSSSPTIPAECRPSPLYRIQTRVRLTPHLSPDHHLDLIDSSGMKANLASNDPHGGDDTIIESEEKPESKSADPADADPSSSDIQEKGEENPPLPERKFTLPQSLAWIPANLTWSQLKLLIRCSLTAWVSLVFAIIAPVSRSLGQVSSTIQSHALT